MRRGALLVALGAALFVSGWARTGQAYPQWQFSTGASRCNECHYAPAGGGLLNGYGRDVAGEELSTFGGRGELLYGKAPLPSWIAVGAELRGAFVAQDVQDINGPTVAAFPMQADAQVRLNHEWISAYGVVGMRGQARSDGEVVPAQNYQPITGSRFVSREHYVTLQPAPIGVYMRAGRYFAPFGLRLAEHILYIRRDLGFGTMEETYNLSGGYVDNRWELHATAFAPDFLRHMGGREGGFAAYAERRFADVAAVAVQARVGLTSEMTRTTVGALGKWWIEPLRTMILVEADLVRRDIDAVDASYQFVGAGGLSFQPIKGLMATWLQERNHVDLSAPNAAYDATTAWVSWFPYAHIELQALGRLQWPSEGQSAKTFLFQLHYYL